MKNGNAYWYGFEDAYCGNWERTDGLDSKEAFAYCKGFTAGMRAAAEAGVQNEEPPISWRYDPGDDF